MKVQFWDTAGQEKFHVITKAYYEGAHGIILTYDVTDQHSFENINYWMSNIQKHANTGVSMIIVGNKTDVEGKRVVDKEQGQAIAAEHNVRYFETSAKDGSGVIDAFNGKPANTMAESCVYEENQMSCVHHARCT